MKKTLIFVSFIVLFISFTSVGYCQYPEDLSGFHPGLEWCKSVRYGNSVYGIANGSPAAFYQESGGTRTKVNE